MGVLAVLIIRRQAHVPETGLGEGLAALEGTPAEARQVTWGSKAMAPLPFLEPKETFQILMKPLSTEE